MLEIKGYITNLGKYNEGELIGEWVTFPIDDEELKEVFTRIGINKEYEEYFFTDWDCEFDNDFGEYVGIQTMNKLAESLADWDDEMFKAVCDIWGIKEALEHSPDDYLFLSDVFTDDDLGYYWIEESGCYNIDGILANYIDYEKFGRDVRLDTDSGHTDYGFIEYIG